jgi:hypothetical protein
MPTPAVQSKNDAYLHACAEQACKLNGLELLIAQNPLGGCHSSALWTFKFTKDHIPAKQCDAPVQAFPSIDARAPQSREPLQG